MVRLVVLVLIGGLSVAAGLAWLRLSSDMDAPLPDQQAMRDGPPAQAEPPVGADGAVVDGALDALSSTLGGAGATATGARGGRPVFDVVRVERDGSALLAGTAEPGSTVTILVDGEPVATLQADSRGAFAGFASLPASDNVRRLDLVARRGDGLERTGGAPVFVAASDAEPDAPAPAVVAAGETGVDLLQRPARGDDTVVSLDLVSYSPGGLLTLEGRGNALRLVRLYANTRLLDEALIAENGTWVIATRVDLEPGRHTLRVDEIDEEGRVTSRTESPFVAEAPEALALRPGEIMIQPGNTLWRLAEQLYGDGVRFTVIYEANSDRIRNPDLIFPGQVLTIPSASVRP